MLNMCRDIDLCKFNLPLSSSELKAAASSDSFLKSLIVSLLFLKNNVFHWCFLPHDQQYTVTNFKSMDLCLSCITHTAALQNRQIIKVIQECFLFHAACTINLVSNTHTIVLLNKRQRFSCCKYLGLVQIQKSHCHSLLATCYGYFCITKRTWMNLVCI